MSKALLYATAFLAGCSASLTQTEVQKELFETFKIDFNKSYETELEEKERFNIFVKNLDLIKERNAKDPTAQHGITKFADLSKEEFLHRFANYSPQIGGRKGKGFKGGIDYDSVPEVKDSEGLVDWTGVLTTPVKNQGNCGSCWAFSATEQIESDYIREQGGPLSTILSPQQMNSCTDYSTWDGSSGELYGSSSSMSYSMSYDAGGGCDGGLTEAGFDYAMDGMELDFYYPYTSGDTGETGDCTSDVYKYVVKTTGYTTVSNTSEGEPIMAGYVQSTGPLSICVDASEWASYTGGIISNCGDDVDHCVQVVGINMDEQYWKVRNSWGPDWAEEGFLRLSYGNNTCQIASDAIYADVVPY